MITIRFATLTTLVVAACASQPARPGGSSPAAPAVPTTPAASTVPAPTSPAPATATASPPAADPADREPAAQAPPTRAQRCAAAVAQVVGGATLAPIDREAHDFTPTAAERKAIGRAAKAIRVLMYEGAEQRKVAAAFDRWITDGASFEVLQAVKLADRRLVVVTFKLDSAPSLDVGPYLEVIASEPRSTVWREITGAFYDPDARIIGTAGAGLVFEKLHAPGELEVWLLSLRKPTGKRPGLGAIKAFARCGA